VLATSANGVRALAARTPLRGMPVFAVGPQTAAAAEKVGFLRIRNSAGDATALAANTREWADPAKGPLLHVAGEEAPGVLANTLTAMGFEVRRENLYRVVSATELPSEARRALAQGQVDAALFFSPRSAEIFAACVRQAGLTTKNLIGLCISENAAKVLDRNDFREIRVAASPNQASILSLIQHQL
jgi:uroporphyrinogen-III synthase